MKVFHFVGALGLVTLLGCSVAFADLTIGGQSRGEVSGSIQGACGADEAACIDAVNKQLSFANQLGCCAEEVGVNQRPSKESPTCGCAAGSISIAQGLADATSAINAANPALATKMAEAVALNGNQWWRLMWSIILQVVFGAVLDGTGTAAVQEVPPVAASPG